MIICYSLVPERDWYVVETILYTDNDFYIDFIVGSRSQEKLKDRLVDKEFEVGELNPSTFKRRVGGVIRGENDLNHALKYDINVFEDYSAAKAYFEHKSSSRRHDHLYYQSYKVWRVVSRFRSKVKRIMPGLREVGNNLVGKDLLEDDLLHQKHREKNTN